APRTLSLHPILGTDEDAGVDDQDPIYVRRSGQVLRDRCLLLPAGVAGYEGWNPRAGRLPQYDPASSLQLTLNLGELRRCADYLGPLLGYVGLHLDHRRDPLGEEQLRLAASGDG